MILIPRIFQGISGAMIFSTNTAILVNAFPKERRGKVLGYSVMMVYAGLSMGPVLGGVLTHNFKWPSIFIVSMIFGLIAFIVAVIGLPKTDDTAHSVTGKGKYDLPGMLLYSIMIFCILYGFSSIGAGSSFDFAFTVFGAQLIFRFNLLLIILGVVLALIFGRHELRARLPVLQLRLFKKNPNFLFSNLASLLNYGATYAVTYLLSIYLQLIALYDAQITGIILIIQPLIQTVLSPLAGRLSDKYSPFKLASLGMAFCTAGLVSYLFITVDTSMVHIIINLVIVGIGFALFSSPNTNAIMSSVKPQDSTVASSLISTMRNLGHVTSMAILTLIMSAHLGSATFQDATPEQLVDTMHTGFIVFTIICAVGIFVSLQRKKK
jgi:MFS family permease